MTLISRVDPTVDEPLLDAGIADANSAMEAVMKA